MPEHPQLSNRRPQDIGLLLLLLPPFSPRIGEHEPVEDCGPNQRIRFAPQVRELLVAELVERQTSAGPSEKLHRSRPGQRRIVFERIQNTRRQRRAADPAPRLAVNLLTHINNETAEQILKFHVGGFGALHCEASINYVSHPVRVWDSPQNHSRLRSPRLGCLRNVVLRAHLV